MKTIESSRLEWECFEIEGEDYVQSYCADGDGFVEVRKQKTGEYTLHDQNDLCASFSDLGGALEAAQDYLAATYNEIFESFAF